MRRLEGKVIVITGAAGGIGRALARLILHEGGVVVLSDLEQPMLEEAAADLKGDPAKMAFIAGDAADPKLGERLAAVAFEQFGRLDGFVPLAGIIRFAPVTELSPAQWDLVTSVNLRGLFFGVQAVGKAMIAHACKGSIVTISSTSAAGPRPHNADYGVSKIGVEHLTKTFALEFASR